MKQTIALTKGDMTTLKIESLAPGGFGVARVNDFIVFVNRALPGQIVQVKIHKKKHNYAEASVVELIERSPDEIDAPCPHFGICGGCLFQNLNYQKQLEYKNNQVIETLQHIGHFENITVQNIIPSPEIFYYRNKMEFSFSDDRWLSRDEIQSMDKISDRNFALGLHVPRRFDKVLNIEKCLLLSERSNEILTFINLWTKLSGLPPYSTSTQSGFWRFLVLREGKNTNQFMINIVTTDDRDHFKQLDVLQNRLLSSFPTITTIVHNVNKKKAQIATGDEEHILFGDGFIYEKLNTYSFQISANAFFQTNTRQAEYLYNKILAWGNFTATDIVYDLYCGTGSIAVHIAKNVHRVVGIELVPQAIDNAQQNCRLNQIDNCVFLQGDLKTQLNHPEELVTKYGKPDTIVIDPPRSGMHPDIPHKIMELSPDRIIYVSCNPATFARDLSVLCQTQYKITEIQPVDMFPHTAHCEVIALLTKN